MCPLLPSPSKPGHEVGWAIGTQANGQRIMLGVIPWVSFLSISKAVSRVMVRGDLGPALPMSPEWLIQRRDGHQRMFLVWQYSQSGPHFSVINEIFLKI